MLLYSSVINALSGLIEAVGALVPDRHPRKFMRFLRGQKGLSRHVRDTYKKDPSRPTVWLHAASFGEYSVARPLISEFRRRGMQIVVTFFSPSGYEALDKHHPEVDYLYYLPFDTNRNVSRFLDTVRPDKAVFIVSEYWFNYLQQLHNRGIDTYLVSAKITLSSIFFRWYGKLYRRCLPSYRHIFVIDEDSKKNLKSLGYKSVSVNGNPLFDNAIEKAAEPWTDPLIERFAAGEDIFIAGSIHDDNDVALVTELVKRNPDVKFLLVPHEVSPSSVGMLESLVGNSAIVYSRIRQDDDLSDAKVMIIDSMGFLAYIYRYARWAYVGGGFTKYLHSLIEATVYGIPVAFGPETRRKITPQQIAERGLGRVVTNADELDAWFNELKNNPEKMDEIAEKAREYVRENAGATCAITDAILSPLSSHT